MTLVSRPALTVLAVCGSQLFAQTLDECNAHRRRGRSAEAESCFSRLAQSRDPYLRAEAQWGLERYTEANEEFKAVIKAQPKNASYRARWGRLFLARFNREEAATLFQEALEIDKNHAGALLGLAIVASDGFESKAVELAEKAIAADPKLVEAREVLASLALEDGNPEKAIAEADRALALSPEALDAMAIRATVEMLADKPGDEWFARVRSVNPSYGSAWALAAHFHVINRRYDEAIRLYRKALEIEPRNWEARSELGINLMRLGEDVEAHEQLEMCYQNGYRNAATVNSLRLLDSYKNFLTFTEGNIILKLHKKEADLLRPYTSRELKRAIQTFETKYKMKLPRPVQLEFYPLHEDFAVRTLGLPGLGALGVTFGSVVAMDSPSGRKPGSFHWASTLWHELSHVFVLSATNHRVPRWFTEGMAVHEETAANPEWGDRLDPEAIGVIRDKKLLPIAQLDRGFVRPSYPTQVVISYFQAGRICDYINQRWGYQKLLDMMHAFGARRTTVQVIEEQLAMKPEEFDRQFLDWLEAQTKKTVEGFAEWRKRVKQIAADAKEKKHDDVIREGTAIRDLYPDYVEAGSVYEFLSEAYLAKDDKTAAAAELERYARAGGRFPPTLKKLATLQEEQGRKKEAAETLARINFIAPVDDEDLHRRLGELWLGQGNLEGAIAEFQAVVASSPIDPAASHFNLARAYRLARKNSEAREHLLLALEAAPSYRPAQKLLLELTKP